MKILSISSLNIDYVYSVDHIFRVGETISTDKLSIFEGGKGLNQSIAIARAGTEVYHAGLIGTEGGFLKESLNKSGVNTGFVKKIDDQSGHAIIQVDKQGSNSICVFPGANHQISQDYVTEVLNEFDENDVLVLQNEINELPFIVNKAKEKGMFIVLNPSPINDELKKVDISKIDLLVLNEIEGAELLGSTTEKMIILLAKKYPTTDILLTLGEGGSEYFSKGGEFYKQEIFPTSVVDTTAAGDTFTGYFISSHIMGNPVPVSLKFASKAASIAVSRKGASSSIPSRKEVLDELKIV